ncbi:MAG: hypothetical protein HC838_02765 [Spirulinaceae cyanobacterium RM2_2_10]|nr:hypothetical protein [Spirulinaceae cyanobacterium SM2_1_0]NJO19197.1 hypothetical protein [Spirulinaceae cyanobacterium RM2_2_10]
MRSGAWTSSGIVAVTTVIVASRLQAIPVLAILYLLILGGFGSFKLWRYWRSRP